jgi:hypothetical protein
MTVPAARIGGAPRRWKAGEARIEALRRGRQPCSKIATQTGVARATVARIGKRKDLSLLFTLEQRPPVIRDEKETPGEMIHIDLKKLGRIEGTGYRITGDRTGQSNGRGKGWEYLHLAIDDPSRLAYSEIFPDEKRKSAIQFPSAILPRSRHQGLPRHDRQRHQPQILSPPQSPAHAWHQAQTHTPLHAKDEWKGRAVRANRITRVGEADQRFQRAKPVGGAIASQAIAEVWPAGGLNSRPITTSTNASNLSCLSFITTTLIAPIWVSTESHLSHAATSTTC